LAEGAMVSYKNALRLFPARPSGWRPSVLTCSALEKRGIRDLWDTILEYEIYTKDSGYFEQQRTQQAVVRMHDTIADCLNSSFYKHEDIVKLMPDLEAKLYEGSITSYKAACILLDKYFKRYP